MTLEEFVLQCAQDCLDGQEVTVCTRCGCDLSSHTEGMRCKTCGTECGLRCTL